MPGERQFDLAKNPPGDHRKRWFVKCSRCDVIATISSNRTSSLPPVVITRKLVERGWLVGANNTRDVCPAHVHVKVKVKADHEMPLVERIGRNIQELEQSIGEYMKLVDTQHQERVVALLDSFHGRVFGNGASS